MLKYQPVTSVVLLIGGLIALILYFSPSWTLLFVGIG